MNSDSDGNLTRRTLLKTGAGGAIGGLLAAEDLTAAPMNETHRDVYGELGVRKIINAAGTFTALGGSLIPPEVVAAWYAASKNFVDLATLQDRVGEKIAALLGVEAALVTTGAAGGMLVATAAALTYRDASRIPRLPLSPAEGVEVIRQKAHRSCYDQQVTTCGVKLVEVETSEDLRKAISPRTAMLLSYNVYEPEGRIRHAEWLQAARQHAIPALLDAAADTPPRENLSRYNQMGYDMVVFSGGKGLRGPQDTGLLLGRKELIEAAKKNTSPHCGSIGRGLKVTKENMVALWAAVERFVKLDPAAETRELERKIAVIEAALQGMPVTAERIVPAVANQFPHLLLRWDETKLRITAAQLKQQLADGDPSIVTGRVHGTGTEGFLISVFTLASGEEQAVAARLREILVTAT